MLSIGPKDSRIIVDDNNQVFLIFNMIDSDKRRKIWLYNFFTGHQMPFCIRNHPLAKVISKLLDQLSTGVGPMIS